MIPPTTQGVVERNIESRIVFEVDEESKSAIHGEEVCRVKGVKNAGGEGEKAWRGMAMAMEETLMSGYGDKAQKCRRRR